MNKLQILNYLSNIEYTINSKNIEYNYTYYIKKL